MTKKLMACNMNFVTPLSIFNENLGLLICSELYRVDCIAAERIIQENILKSFSLSDVIVVRNIYSKRAAVCCKPNNIESSEVWSEERIFLLEFRPWKERNNSFRFCNQFLKLFWFRFINDCYPAFIITAFVCWINIGLDPAHVTFDNRTLIFYPLSLRLFV